MAQVEFQGPCSGTLGWGSRKQPRSMSSGSAPVKAAQLLTLGSAWIPNKLCVHSALSPLITLPGPGCLCAWDRADPRPQSIPREQLRAAHSKYKPRFFWRTGGSSFCLLCTQSVLSFCCFPWCVASLGLNYFWCCQSHIKETVFRGTHQANYFPLEQQ